MTAARIALFVPTLSGGGAERIMLELARGFAARGNDIDLVLGARTGELAGEVDPRVHVIELGTKRVGSSVVPLARVLRRRRPDALLSAMTHANVAALAARLLTSRATRPRVVVSEQSSLSARLESMTELRQRALYRIARRAYRSADAVVACSTGVRQELAHHFGLGATLHVVYNPVDHERVQTRAAQAITLPWADGDTRFLLSVGRLVPEKGFDLLLRAHAQVRREQRIRLVLLGEGRERPALLRLAEQLGTAEDVVLPGFVDNPYAWMARASAVVLSSRREGLPTVLVEALVVGAPIAAFDCEWGPSEILEGGRVGSLAPPGDIEGLAAAIRSALAEGRSTDAVAQRRERARAFSVDAAVDSYLELLLGPTSVRPNLEA